jgi:hypothetical protein
MQLWSCMVIVAFVLKVAERMKLGRLSVQESGQLIMVHGNI